MHHQPMSSGHSARPLAIIGTGHALPERCIASAALDQQLGLPAGTVAQRGGVAHRYQASNDQTAAMLGAAAARQAMAAAGLHADQLDLVVGCSATMDQGMPGNAALIHRELGLGDSGIAAIDINASCLGFLAALDQLSWPIAAGRYQRVLLVAADLASVGLDWQHLEASAIFGDGAAAVVLAAGDAVAQDVEGVAAPQLLASELMTFSSGASLCQIEAGGSRWHPSRWPVDARPGVDPWQAFAALSRFQMQGPALFRLASRHIDGLIDRLMRDAGLSRAQIDWVVPHQASHLAMQHLQRKLGFAADRVIDIFAEHGNQVAASLPTALDIGIRSGKIRRGHRLLLIGTGAGVSLGGAVMVY